jgi:hypothetical protein
MIKSTTCVLLLCLRIFVPVNNPHASAFAPAYAIQAGKMPAHLLSISGNLKDKKIWIQWTVNDNQTADQFVVEKSSDGKTYNVAALVFGSDNPETETYRFYEKVDNKKLHYRVKLINKDKQEQYSSSIIIRPNS